MTRTHRLAAALGCGSLVLGLVVPLSVSGVAAGSTFRDCSGRTVEAGADLRRCDLSGAVIIGLDLHAVDLSRANLEDVDAGCDPDQPRTNLTAARLFKADAQRALLCDAILVGADLRGADLRGASLEDADLRAAGAASIRLDGAGANFAQFTDARMAHASLRWLAAVGATFNGADLRGVDARDGDLAHARFVDADLRGAQLDRTDLTMADLSGADLDRATGLETVTWSATTCPDGTNSDADGGPCVGHLG
jgi:uncharacterized protein YjbI with pentapeptide repeats